MKHQSLISIVDITLEDFDSSIYTNISGAKPLKIVNGQGIYSVKTGGTGVKSYKGFIKIPQENEDKYYPFEGQYTVAKSTTVVSPTNFQAMYKGIKNPVTIAVPGYNSKDLTVRFDAGVVKGSSGKYNITPKIDGKKEGTVTVYGPNSKGKKVKLGFVKFSLYPIPPPTITFSLDKDVVSKADLRNDGQLLLRKKGILKMFKGINYRIKSFTVIGTAKNGQALKEKNCKTLQQGKAESLISKLPSGSTLVQGFVIFEYYYF